MKAQQTFNTMFENKLNTLMPYLVKTTRGDEDLIQEGAIGIYMSMKEQPYAANKYHTTKAKWNITSVSRGVGRSVDIPKRYERKVKITLVHYDAIPEHSLMLDRLAGCFATESENPIPFPYHHEHSAIFCAGSKNGHPIHLSRTPPVSTVLRAQPDTVSAKTGEIRLIDTTPEESAAAKLRLDDHRGKRRERHQRSRVD